MGEIYGWDSAQSRIPYLQIKYDPFSVNSLTVARESVSSVDLSWTPPAQGSHGYRVYRNGVYIASTAATTFSDEGSTPGAASLYQVVPVTFEGFLGELELSPKVYGGRVLRTPAVQATRGQVDFVDITWDPIPSAVKYGLEGGAISGTTTDTNARHQPWLDGVLYSYGVRAVAADPRYSRACPQSGCFFSKGSVTCSHSPNWREGSWEISWRWPHTLCWRRFRRHFLRDPLPPAGSAAS